MKVRGLVNGNRLLLTLLGALVSQVLLKSSFALLIGKNPRDNDLCKSVSVTVNYALKPDCSFTTYCYTITTCTRGVVGWTITGKTPFLARLSSAFGEGVAYPGNVTSFKKISSRVERMSQCFTLPKKSNPTFGNIKVILEGGIECYDSIRVPLLSTECKCSLNKDPALVNKGPCIAACQEQVASAVGNRINTWAVDKPGGDCTSTFNEVCTKTCPVNCVLELEPQKQCDSGCNVAEKEYTRWWTTATPSLNGGNVCPIKNPNYVVQYCKANPCPVDCVLDRNRCPDSCHEPCIANCIKGVANADGQKLCRYETLVEPLNGGKPCVDTSTMIPCTKKCPVDCVLQIPKPEDIPCPANCATPTSTKTLLATVIRQGENGGNLCPKDLVFGKEICSLSPEVVAGKCSDECVVDGIPENPCLQKCTGVNPPVGNFSAIAKYPNTLQYPFRDSEECPYYSTFCNCKNCMLAPTPTQISPCNAKCTLYDDSFAIGSRTLAFSTVRAAARDGTCNTVSVERCSIKCNCAVKSTIEGSCIPTDITSLKKPWTGYGIAEETPIGGIGECSSIKTKSCTTILEPKNCRFSRSCEACHCTSTEGPNYVNSEKHYCTNSIFGEELYGGAPCPTSVTYPACSQTCIGCVYTEDPICKCKYTKSNPRNEDTLYYGYSSCSYPLVTLLPQIKYENPDYSASELCTSKISKHFQNQCTVTLPNGKCDYATKSCERCTLTRTSKNPNGYVALGTQTCILNDLRGLEAPKICTNSETLHSCSVKLFPTDCRISRACSPCSVTCKPGDDGIKSTTAKCYYKTVQTPDFGGAPCPSENEPPASCSKHCESSSNAPIVPEPIYDPFLNGFFSGQYTGQSSSVGGRLIVCGKASLLDFSVGSIIDANALSCDSLLPALQVGSDLMMLGRVLGGSVRVSGNCSDVISSDCGIDCANLNQKPKNSPENCWNKTLDCASVAKFASNMAISYSNTVSNVLFEKKSNGVMHLTWNKQAKSQVLVIPSENSFPMLPWANFIGDVADNSKFTFIILGSKVSMKGFSLKYFEKRAKLVYWIFPSAKELYLDSITIHGNVIAPIATIFGGATVNGVVLAKSHIGTYDRSLKLTLP